MVYYDSQIITSQVVFSAIIVWLFRMLKQSKHFAFINDEATSYKINKLIAVVASFIVAVGINWTYSYSPEGMLTLQISGLTPIGIYAGVKQWIFSYIVQQTGYRITEPAK